MGMLWWIGSQVWPALAAVVVGLSGYVVHLKVKEQRSEIADRDRQLEEAKRAEAAMDSALAADRDARDPAARGELRRRHTRV